MFEPLREILPEDPQALIDDARVLGEKAGRLYGSRSAAAYVALGGAIYQPLQCVNEGVVGWGEPTTAHSSYTTNSTTTSGGPSPRSSSLVHGDSWVATALAWFTSSSCDSRRRPHRRRGPLNTLSAVRALLSAAPHVLPRLLHGAATVAAFGFPGIRALCPTAVPDASRLIAARQSCDGGPERVTAVSFHPLYLWLAVAIDAGAADGSTRVVVYDVADEKVACVLSHAFQKEVNWLQWKPFATDVLAVGCRGGVLLWSLGAAGAAGARAARSSAGEPRVLSAAMDGSARALFYPTRRGFTLTAAAFSNRDGSVLACASAADTRLHLLNLRQPPFSPLACAAVVVPSVDGGLREVVFTEDDLCMICAVCEHSSLALVQSAVTTSVAAVPQTRVVPVPAPVECIARASGLRGPSLFFLSMKGLEGVVLARVNFFTGVEVLSMISTGLYRGIGGCVTHFTCSRRRLWMQTETNHLIVCHYGQTEGNVTLLPVGVAATEAVALASFSGCSTGSLVAVVERGGTISFLPSYHS